MNKYLLAFCAIVVVALQPVSAVAEEGKLAAVLAAQPDEVKARYQYRHPQETIEFFGIEPGMTVVEGLPGGGWYTKILLPYLGGDGHLIGANYPLEFCVCNRRVHGRDVTVAGELAGGCRGVARRGRGENRRILVRRHARGNGRDG